MRRWLKAGGLVLGGLMFVGPVLTVIWALREGEMILGDGPKGMSSTYGAIATMAIVVLIFAGFGLSSLIAALRRQRED